MLKEELHERVRRLVDAGLGYRSLSEFIEDAVRRRVEELERLYNYLPPKPAARPPAAASGEGGAREQRRPTRGNEPRPEGVEAAEAAAGVRADAG